MVIKQTTEELKQAIALNCNSDLISIRVTQAELWSAPTDNLIDDQEAETEIAFRPTVVRRQSDSLGLTIEFHFGVSSGVDKPMDLLKVNCRFEAVYSIATDFEPTNEQIAAFHKGNAVFNCWPFFREFVQNATVRMHIPPPAVPFLRIMPAVPTDPPNAPQSGGEPVPARRTKRGVKSAKE